MEHTCKLEIALADGTPVIYAFPRTRLRADLAAEVQTILTNVDARTAAGRRDRAARRPERGDVRRHQQTAASEPDARQLRLGRGLPRDDRPCAAAV